MSVSNWYRKAAMGITEAIAEGRAAGEDRTAIRKRVDAAYPFGERKYWPYKQWIQARRNLFSLNDLSTDAEIARHAKVLQRRIVKRGRVNALDFEGARADGLIL